MSYTCDRGRPEVGGLSQEDARLFWTPVDLLAVPGTSLTIYSFFSLTKVETEEN